MWAWIIQAVGLIVLAVGYWAMQTFVVNSPNPALWAQSVQMVQAVLFLWPPFMLAYRYRQAYRQLLTKMDTMLNNLPHTMD